MAPRPLRGRNRARNLALPFVVTAAAAACTVKPATQTPHTAQQPSGAHQHQDANGATNDHRSGAEAGSTTDHRGEATDGKATDHRGMGHTSNPPPPAKVDQAVDHRDPKTTAPTSGPAKASDPKKPIVITNPPAPRPKPALQPAPTKGGRVVKQSDGSCIWVQKVTCVPGASCNPPRPKAVKCPSALKPKKGK